MSVSPSSTRHQSVCRPDSYAYVLTIFLIGRLRKSTKPESLVVAESLNVAPCAARLPPSENH